MKSGNSKKVDLTHLTDVDIILWTQVGAKQRRPLRIYAILTFDRRNESAQRHNKSNYSGSSHFRIGNFTGTLR